MTFKRLIDLWTHRYRKYSHIFRAHASAYRLTLHYLRKKRAFPQGKALIAVVRTEHFGDIVATEPLSRHIRDLHPDAHIVWFVKPVFRELVEVNPHVDEVFPESCVTQRQVLLKSSIFDKVYELQFRNNNYCPKCQVYIENPTALAKGITVDTYFNFGNLLEVFASVGGLTLPYDRQPRIYLKERHRQAVDALQLPSSLIVIHCQSNYAPKDWPAEKWRKLVGWLLESYPHTIVEIGLSSNLYIEHPNYINLTGRLSILESAEVIRRAKFFVGLDSGPAHLANAAGTFGFILMGALDTFKQYNPYSGAYGSGENCVIIRDGDKPCSQLSFKKVRDSFESVLPSAALSENV